MTAHPYMNRWTVSLSWMVGMLIVWSLFVPRPVSATTFVLLAAIGPIVSVFGAMFLKDSRPPQSVPVTLGELEAQPKTDSLSRRNR